MEPYRSELKGIIGKIGYDYNIEIVELETSIDHIPMVVAQKVEDKFAPARYIAYVLKSTGRNWFVVTPVQCSSSGCEAITGNRKSF